MSITREKKETQIKELQDAVGRNGTFYLLDYINISVSKSTELRRKLRENDCSLKVIKNRLALRALKDEFPEEVKAHFQGPTAIAYTAQNPIALARLLKDFSTQHRILKVKGGMVEGDYLAEERFREIANLSSRLDLVAKLGYLMAYPLTQFLRSMKAPFGTMGSMMSQLKDKRE